MIINSEQVRSVMLLAADALLLAVSFIIALQLAQRDLADIHYRWFEYLWMLVIVIVVKLFIFHQTGLYREVIKFASMEFAVKIVKSTVFGSLIAITLIYIARREIGMPVLVVDWMASCILIGLSRFGMRYVMEGRFNRNADKNTLLYGAGEHGAAVARHLMLNDHMGHRVVGFIDDDMTKDGKKVQGIPILGNLNNLSDAIIKSAAEEIIVAFAEPNGEKIKNLIRKCREHGVRCRIVPGMADVITGNEFVRNIDIADLMRRPKRKLDTEMIAKFLKGRRVLITGAAGSIGSEIFRQVLSYQPAALAAIDNSEFGLYKLDEEFSSHPLKSRCLFSLVDIRHKNLVEDVTSAFQPEIVFHAAAYKHVPILEQDAKQAVHNNVEGLQNIIQTSERHGVKKFVFISTDKAVRPTNVMGATKRIGELITQSHNGTNGMKGVSVRFGNVLASSGSVVPKFIEQIKVGGPVTVTHPEVTRFFMLIPEAVELVLQAASFGDGGEIFVLNMGKPVKIAEMAEDLISLMGHVPHVGIAVKYTGLRPGEKLCEELFLDEIESITPFKDISIVKTQKIDKKCFERKLEMLFTNVIDGDGLRIRQALKNLVPEYRYEKY